MATDTTPHDETTAPPAAEAALEGDDRDPDVLGPHEHQHPKDTFYIIIALVLAVLTALEVSTYYLDFGPLFLPTLLVLMTVKFLLVVLFFMHLKFDAPLFGRLFWTGVVLALLVYIAALSTFHVFTP